MRLPNPAKTLADIGHAGSIELKHRRHDFDIDGNLTKNRSEWLAVRIEVDGANWAMVDARRRRGGASFHIIGADAEGGWGPLAYDILMEYATTRGSGLSPDVASVSTSARAVWSHYVAHRRDVTRSPAPTGILRREQAMFEHAPFIYTKAPTTLVKLASLPHVQYEGLWQPYASRRDVSGVVSAIAPRRRKSVASR